MTATAQTSSRRAEANRRNSLKSTGPRSTAGKERAKFNALTHGLRAKTLVLPGEDPAAYEQRLDEWLETFRPASPVEQYLVGRAVHLSWQIDRFDRAETALLVAATAEPVSRQESRPARIGAELLSVPIGMDDLFPDWSDGLESTGRTGGLSRCVADLARDLEATAAGCGWMLARWAELRRRLEQGSSWRPTDRLRAVRLLGKQPLHAGDDERLAAIYLACHAMEPTGPDPFAEPMAQAVGSDRTKLRRKLAGLDRAALAPADPAAGRAALLAIVDAAVARLEALRDERAESEPPAAAILAARLDPRDRETLERLRLHQGRFGQSLLRTVDALRKVRKDLGEIEASDPEPDDGPVPVVDDAGPPSSHPAPLGIEPIAAAAPAVTNEAIAAEVAPFCGANPPSASAGDDRPHVETAMGPPAQEPPTPGDEPEDVTNEANGPPGSGRGPVVAALAILWLLFFAGISAAFGMGTAPPRSSFPLPRPTFPDPRPARTVHLRAAPEVRERTASPGAAADVRLRAHSVGMGPEIPGSPRP